MQNLATPSDYCGDGIAFLIPVREGVPKFGVLNIELALGAAIQPNSYILTHDLTITVSQCEEQSVASYCPSCAAVQNARTCP